MLLLEKWHPTPEVRDFQCRRRHDANHNVIATVPSDDYGLTSTTPDSNDESWKWQLGAQS